VSQSPKAEGTRAGQPVPMHPSPLLSDDSGESPSHNPSSMGTPLLGYRGGILRNEGRRQNSICLRQEGLKAAGDIPPPICHRNVI